MTEEDDMAVTLVVKAPNQQIADQRVCASSSWTVGALKDRLAEVYPCKPRRVDQKLIYAGRLLADDVVLRDTLRRYEGQERDTHTLHLVCAPSESDKAKTIPINNTTNTTTTTTTTAAAAPTPTPSAPAASTSTTAEDDSNVRRDEYSYYASQWNSYVNHMLSAGYDVDAGAEPPNVDPIMHVAAQIAWMHHIGVQQYFNASGPPQPLNPLNSLSDHLQAPENVPDDRNVRENIIDARQPPVDVNVDNGDGDNRDWLDRFYNFSRWLLMFSIVYFYSNPIRFFTVLILGTTIYLFQARLNHEAVDDRRANADNLNNNRRPRDNGANEDESAENAQVVDDERDDEESLLSITWTAFASFFSSLIPEVPNARN